MSRNSSRAALRESSSPNAPDMAFRQVILLTSKNYQKRCTMTLRRRGSLFTTLPNEWCLWRASNPRPYAYEAYTLNQLSYTGIDHSGICTLSLVAAMTTIVAYKPFGEAPEYIAFILPYHQRNLPLHILLEQVFFAAFRCGTHSQT